ncbi:Transcriptional regulator [Comamonas aquatilis]|uniref:AraC family transcriptional regulator n=1 Tax=Comamonas aquatilis TaxID=1778406 RepID=UPI0039F0D043
MKHRIRSINLSRYAKVIPEFGINPFEMFRQVGVDHSWLDMPDLLVPEKVYAQLLTLSTEQTRGASLGVLMGSCWRLSDFGKLSLLLQHQANLAALLQTLKTYSHLIGTTLAVEVVTHGQLSIIQLHLNSENENPGRHRIEVGITALLCLCRHQLGKDWKPISTHFSHVAPHSTKTYRQVIEGEIVFGSGFDGIVVSNHDLHLSKPEYDNRMEQHARALMDSHVISSSPMPMDRQVRDAIQSLLPHGRHSISQVASTLGYSVRALQRQLESNNTNFQKSLDEVRTAAVIRALQNPQLSMSDAASLAGFTESSSFTRWFSKHFDQSPSSWRQQHLRHQILKWPESSLA